MSTILTDLPEEVKPAFSQWGLLLDLWSFPSLSPPISYDYEILVEIIKRLTLRDRMVLCLLTCQRFRRGTATGRAVWQTVDFTGFSLSSDPQVRGESALSAAWAISTLAPVDSVKDLILDGYQVETTPLFLFCQAFSKLTSLCINWHESQLPLNTFDDKFELRDLKSFTITLPPTHCTSRLLSMSGFPTIIPAMVQTFLQHGVGQSLTHISLPWCSSFESLQAFNLPRITSAAFTGQGIDCRVLGNALARFPNVTSVTLSHYIPSGDLFPAIRLPDVTYSNSLPHRHLTDLRILEVDKYPHDPHWFRDIQVLAPGLVGLRVAVSTTELFRLNPGLGDSVTFPALQRLHVHFMTMNYTVARRFDECAVPWEKVFAEWNVPNLTEFTVSGHTVKAVQVVERWKTLGRFGCSV